MTKKQWLSYVGKWIYCNGKLSILSGQWAYIYSLHSFGYGEANLDEIFFGKDGVKVTVGGFADLKDWIVYSPDHGDVQKAIKIIFEGGQLPGELELNRP
jgi:hypothetical protein